MSQQFVSRLPRSSRTWFVGTLLEAHGDAYVDYLTDRGYATATVDCYLCCVAHFAHWSESRLAGLEDVDERLSRRFMDRHLPVCQCAKRCVRSRAGIRAALSHLLAMLRSKGLTAQRSQSPLPAAIANELKAFDGYLTAARGLQAATRHRPITHARSFLLAHFANRDLDLAMLVPEDMERFTERHTANCKPSSIRQVCTSLRSYLSYKATQGVQTTRLKEALPRVAQWRLSTLPRTISETEIEQLLGAFDCSTATGRRDYAIARCYLDLGLRTAEITRLRLDDVEWSRGRLLISAKGRRTDVLPLPASTGQAIVEYLRLGRPQTSSRVLFVRHRPPHDSPATTDTIRGAVRNPPCDAVWPNG